MHQQGHCFFVRLIHLGEFYSQHLCRSSIVEEGTHERVHSSKVRRRTRCRTCWRNLSDIGISLECRTHKILLSISSPSSLSSLLFSRSSLTLSSVVTGVGSAGSSSLFFLFYRRAVSLPKKLESTNVTLVFRFFLFFRSDLSGAADESGEEAWSVTC